MPVFKYNFFSQDCCIWPALQMLPVSSPCPLNNTSRFDSMSFVTSWRLQKRRKSEVTYWQAAKQRITKWCKDKCQNLIKLSMNGKREERLFCNTWVSMKTWRAGTNYSKSLLMFSLGFLIIQYHQIKEASVLWLQCRTISTKYSSPSHWAS